MVSNDFGENKSSLIRLNFPTVISDIWLIKRNRENYLVDFRN